MELGVLLGTAYWGLAACVERRADEVAVALESATESVASAAFMHSTRLAAVSSRLHASIRIGATRAVAALKGDTASRQATDIPKVLVMFMLALLTIRTVFQKAGCRLSLSATCLSKGIQMLIPVRLTIVPAKAAWCLPWEPHITSG